MMSMDLPPSDHADHRLSDRAVYFLACVIALLYGCSLLTANVFPFFPRRVQEHGWPCVYMVRERKVAGPFTILYGPWPFDDPPIERFSPIALAFNVVVGIVLMSFAAAISIYWLTAQRTRLQFGLFTLFEVFTGIVIWLKLAKASSGN